MTLSSTTTKVAYNGDGATTEFAIGFVFWDSNDLRVIHRDAADAETVWARGTHYTVSGGAGEAGTLTVLTAPVDHTPAAGETLTIKDYQAETQGDSLPLSGAFPSTVVEARLDRLTRLIQIHSEEIARSILLPETSGLSGLKIPEPGAGELVRYNPAGTSLETVRAGDLGLGIDALLTGLATNDFLRWDNAQSAWVNIAPGVAGLALLQDASTAAALATLGVDAAKAQALGTAAVANTGVANGQVPPMDATGYPAADGSQITNLTYANIANATGKVLQTVQTRTGEVATGTTIMPFDDTIPQNTEGDEYMALEITPKSANSRLRVDVVSYASNSAASDLAMALFRDAIADALAAAVHGDSAAITTRPLALSYDVASPGTSTTTFRIRIGNSVAGTTTFNGKSGVRVYGGVMASSIIITEYLP